MKKVKVDKVYRETQADRKERVREEAGMFRPRVEQLATNYDRRRGKKELQKMIYD